MLTHLRSLTYLASIAAALVAAPSMTSQAVRAEATSKTGLHYAIEGRGPDLVLIHAFQMDLREWDAVVPALAERYRVMRYDVRGHGRSTAQTPLPSTTTDLTALLDELGIAHATVVGLSMGATVAVDFALAHPDRVDRLVLVSPGVPGIGPTPDLAWLQPVFDAVRDRRPERAAGLWWQSRIFDQVRVHPTAALAERIVRDNAPIWRYSERAPAAVPPAGTRLAELRLPVLTIAGGADPLGGAPIARAVASGVVHGRYVEIPGAGHMISLERPSELAALIADR